AQAAAIASLEARDELMARVDVIVAERDRVMAGLAEHGWSMPATEANFVWFPLGVDSGDFEQACQAAGLMVRRYGDDGVRVTIGEPEANTRFLQVCRAFGPR
ncbi:MAG: aminotransferase class I/II-fold pyridoxal phosphate-dependent enzyme, partial [Candidatus Phosphoribacter sp.]